MALNYRNGGFFHEYTYTHPRDVFCSPIIITYNKITLSYTQLRVVSLFIKMTCTVQYYTLQVVFCYSSGFHYFSIVDFFLIRLLKRTTSTSNYHVSNYDLRQPAVIRSINRIIVLNGSEDTYM